MRDHAVELHTIRVRNRIEVHFDVTRRQVIPRQKNFSRADQRMLCCRLHKSVCWVYLYKSMVGNTCPTAVHDMCILGAVLYKHLKSHFVYAIHLSLEFLHTLLVNPNNMN